MLVTLLCTYFVFNIRGQLSTTFWWLRNMLKYNKIQKFFISQKWLTIFLHCGLGHKTPAYWLVDYSPDDY